MSRIQQVSSLSLLRPLVWLALAGAASAQTQELDLSNWQVVQYELNFQPDASWELQPGNTSVLQTVNSDASLFLGDFDAVGQEIRGTWRVETAGDDDFMGFTFGYQDRGQFYLFDWKETDQTFQGDFAEAGMTLKVVHMPPGTDPTQDDLWPTIGSANVTPLEHNTIPWTDGVDYEFVLSWVPGTIDITVLEGAQVLEHWTVSDDTYVSGRFGFYNYSQDDVRYMGFTQEGVPEIYCTAKTNSLGCTPSMAYAGFASLSDSTPFDVTASMLLNNQNGGLVLSQNGEAAIPFAGGTLCVQSPLLFSGVMNTGGSATGADCTGQLNFDVNGWLQGGGLPGVMIGDQLNAQYFYRDPQHPDGTGTGLTEGIEFFVLP